MNTLTYEEEWWESSAYDKLIKFMKKQLGEGTMDQFFREVQTDEIDEWLLQTRIWVAGRSSACSSILMMLQQFANEIMN